MIRYIFIIVSSVLIFIFVYVQLIRIKNYIKPKIKEYYLDYSPYNLTVDSDVLKHEKELHAFYAILSESIRKLLKKKNIIKIEDELTGSYIINLDTTADHPYIIVRNKITVLQEEEEYLINDLESTFGDLRKRDEHIKLLEEEEIDKDIIKIDGDINNSEKDLLQNIIKYIFKDLSKLLQFLKNHINPIDLQYTKTYDNLILNLISIGYIERKVEEISTYYRSESDYINLKIREYVKLMNNFGIFSKLYSGAKDKRNKRNKRNKFFSENEFKMNYIKDNLYNADNAHHNGEYIWTQYISYNNKPLFNLDLSGIKQYNDTDTYHAIENNYEQSIPISDLKNILNKIKTDNATKYNVTNNIPLINDILEEEGDLEGDIRYTLKNETLIEDIINNEIMININKNLQYGKKQFFKNHKIDENQYSYKTDYEERRVEEDNYRKRAYEERETYRIYGEEEENENYKIFEKEFQEDYKYLNHSIVALEKLSSGDELTLRNENPLTYNINSLNDSDACKKYPDKKTTMNLCDAYKIQIELDIYKEYTNNVYKIILDLIIFDDYKIPYTESEIEEEMTIDQKIYDYTYTRIDSNNDKKTLSNVKIINDLIKNKVFSFRDFEIIKTYYKELYIDNKYDLNDTRLKYEQYDKHYNHKHYHGPNHHKKVDDNNHKINKRYHNHEHEHDDAYAIETKTSKYFNDTEFINKLVCDKKLKDSHLLHNYQLIDDKFTHF